MKGGGGSGGGGFGDPFDLFGNIFGGGGGRRQRDDSRTKDVVHELGCTLQDMYNGKTKKLAINRKVNCDACHGSGSKDPSAGTPKCESCRGQGVTIQLRKLGPGFVQQVQVECPQCHGTGKFVARKNRCEKCNGEGLARKKQTMEVIIDKGVLDGHRITFSGMADEEIGKTTGDVVIVLDERPAKGFNFERKGMDLVMQLEITLGEALTGFQKVISAPVVYT